MSYAKLFSSIIHSTIWREPAATKVVWITMLAMANRRGVVEASIPGLADAAKVTLEECQIALSKLSAPDEWSRTKEYSGRRIEEIEGGWLILNYEKHRTTADQEDVREQARVRARRFRASRSTVTEVRDSNAPSRKITLAASPAPAPAPDVVRSPLIPSTTTILVGPGSVPSEARHEARALTEATAVGLVFDYWRQKTNHPRAVWNEARRRHLLVRLREEPGDLGMKVAGLCQAVDGALRDPLFNGSEKGRSYLEFENIFIHKGRDRIEKLQGVARGESAPAAGVVRQDDLEDGNKRAVVAAIQKSRAMKGLPEGGA